jgi:hypothetical protein
VVHACPYIHVGIGVQKSARSYGLKAALTQKKFAGQSQRESLNEIHRVHTPEPVQYGRDGSVHAELYRGEPPDSMAPLLSAVLQLCASAETMMIHSNRKTSVLMCAICCCCFC